MASVLEYFVNYDKIPLSKRIGMSNVKDQTHRNMNRDEEFELEGRHINWQTGINIPDPETGLTPLMLASIHGRRDLVIALLERGAEVEYSEANNGRTALHFACKAGHADVVAELLKRGALVNAKDNHNKTPILIASKGGYSDVLKQLLPRGAGVNSTDDRGLSPLHYAAKFGHFDVLDILINHRGAIELRDNVEGFAPIHYAAQYGRKECVKCLLDYGGKVNRRTTKDKLTALMLASREGNKSIVSFLISRGADVSLYDIYGWAALHFAASWGRKDTAQILLVDGQANINQRCARADNPLTGTPPLCIAAKGSQVDVVKLLLHYGADINLSDIHTGHAALAYAAEAGMTFPVQTLIEYGAHLNRRSEVSGRTALMEAVHHGRHSCITKLLDALADLNILDFRMASCWEIAVQTNHQEVLLGALLQASRRAKVNALPWLQMHFHQLTDYHRWDEYHVHDEYDLLYDRTVQTVHQYDDSDDETALDDEDDDDEEGDGDGAEGEPGEMKEQRRREGVFEQARQRNKAQNKRKGSSNPRSSGGGGGGGVKRAGAATSSLLPGTDRQQQQTKYLKRAYATAGQYLKAYLFGREGCFSGLFSLPGDCDVYLVYNLMMILSTCVQPQHVPEDIVIFQEILAKVGHMLVALFQADQTQQLPTMIDVLLMGKQPVETILPELLATTAFHDATRLLSSSFFFGPWAMFLESFAYDFESLWYHVTYQYGQPTAKYTHPAHGLWRSPVSNIFLQPRIKQMIHQVFHTWDKEHGLIVDGYGYYSEKALYARYCPVTMYYLEGLGRALLVVAIVYYSAQGSVSQRGSYASYLYPSSPSSLVLEAGQQRLQPMELILAALVVSLGLYEWGLIEEKRWAVSPAMVFRHETLERFRWKQVYYHFTDDPYKLLDGVALALGITWVLCRYVVYGIPPATMPQHVGLNLLSAGTQALTLCLLPQVLGLARYLGTCFPEFGKVCFGIAFLVYDLWPYLLVYLLVSLALGSALAGILTMSPLRTFHYLLSFLFFGGSSSGVLSSGGSASGSGSLDEYITRAAHSPEVNPVYTTILILMIVVCFPTTGIIFLSIIQRLFSRHQAPSAGSGSGSGGGSGGGGGLGTAAASTTTNPVEFHGYNAGPGSSPDDVIEKYYYYWHCRRVQEHSLVLEKSAWCMLPPPLNLCAVGYYIPHVYLGWRARLRFDVDITVSWGGYVTDTVLFLLVLVPCAVYEYCLKNVYGIHRIVTQNYETDRADLSPESNFGRFMGLLYLPFGCLYTMVCLVYKFTHDPCARMIIKTRLADGRCRMSRGMLRDIYEANVLARLEDFRLHGHWRFYASTHPQMNREYEYNAFEKKAIAVANLKKKPTSAAAAAAAYAAMGGVVDVQKPFTTAAAPFAVNGPKYTEEIYTHEFSEFQSSRASGKIRRGGAWDAEGDDDYADDGGGSSVTGGGGGGGSVSFAQSTKFKERGGRYLQYDEEDRQRLQALDDGVAGDADDMDRLVGTEYPRVPRSVTLSLWSSSGNENEAGSWWGSASSWVPFRRRYRPSDYVGRKIKIVPQRPYLQLQRLHTTLPEAHPWNQPQPLPDNPAIAVPQHFSLDQVLSKMAKDLRLRKWKAHQEMLLRTKQVASRQNLFVGELDAASLMVTDGMEGEGDGDGGGGGGGLMRNPLEGEEGEGEDDYLFFGPAKNGTASAQQKPPTSSSWSFASASHQQQRREHLMDRKEAKHPDHFRRPRLIFQSLVQQFRNSSSSAPSAAAAVTTESTPLDAMAQRDISMYQPGIETERQWALLAYEHDLVTTHHAYASKRSAWQRARSQRAHQPGQSRFGWHGRHQQPPTSQAQARQSTHNRRGGGGGGGGNGGPATVGNDRTSSTAAWMGKDLSSVTHQGRRPTTTIADEGEGDTDDRWLQQQSTWSLSPTLLEEQTHVLFQPTSLYYQPYHHPPLFTAREREAIFRPALPEYFPSDFARAMLDVDLNVTLLQEMLPWLLEKQVQAMDHRIQRRMETHYQQLHHQQHQHLQQQQQQFYDQQQQHQQQQQQQQNSWASSGMMMMSGSINGGGGGGMGMGMVMDDERRSSFFSSSSRPRSPMAADTLLTMTQDDSLYGGGGGGRDGSFYGGGHGGMAMRPMGEEESAYSRPTTAAVPLQPSSMVVPGGQLYGDDDDEPSVSGPTAAAAMAAAFVASAPTANTTAAATASGVISNKRPVSSGRRSVSFYQEPSFASTVDGPETTAGGGGTAATAAPIAAAATMTTNAIPPGSSPIASGGGRIRHDNVVNYMVASGKDPTRYTGNGAVWY